MPSPTVFVCGATGTQGGALIDHLLKTDVKIHAVTRTPNSAAAQLLKSRGVLITEGDFDDDSVKKSMANCTSLFLNLMPALTNLNASLEQACRLLKIAKEAGIKQVIYTSGVSAKDPQRLKLWDPTSIISVMMLNKQAIENEVRKAGFESWTIFRPGNFMNNYLSPKTMMYPGFIKTGVFTTAFAPDTLLPMVDPNDIGQFAAAAVLDPVKFNHQEIEIASELLGIDATIQSLSRATGREMSVVYLSDEEISAQKATNPFIAGQLMARDLKSFVDLDKVKAWNIPLGTFEQFLQREKSQVDATYL
ncbi:NAD(P)-binding domain [Penicillium camemberti]|uniref:NAD(P)-binding domain n=1 Tax=Penicillium camemberti (strain FM 013) TaxID=1429867 RepID=A0A0G4PDL4_PENC3|nr:NAD(P)-binding domain [Penicillium camemberti]